jgi:hypothetical protein
LEYSCRINLPQKWQPALSSSLCFLHCLHLLKGSWNKSPLVSGTKTKANGKATISLQENKKNVTEVPNVGIKDRNVSAIMKLETQLALATLPPHTPLCLAASGSQNWLSKELVLSLVQKLFSRMVIAPVKASHTHLGNHDWTMSTCCHCSSLQNQHCLSSNSPVLTAYDSHEAQMIPIMFKDTSITSTQGQVQGLGFRA